MNGIFLALVSAAFAVAAFRQYAGAGGDPTPMALLSNAIVADAGAAVTLALGLIGVMTLFLGLMKVAEAGGLLAIIARLLRPALRRLFPQVPADHPAMGAMILNIAANVLGLGNAATPFGIRAMQHLDTLNPQKGTASNAMVLFLAINTSSVTLLPTGVIALRAAAGSSDPAGILPTTLFATCCSTAIAILLAQFCARFSPASQIRDPAFAPPTTVLQAAAQAEELSAQETAHALALGGPPLPAADYPVWLTVGAGMLVLLAVPLTIVCGHAIAPWIIPALVVALLAFGAVRKVRIYEAFVEGARDGFPLAMRIIPYLVAILVAVGMLRASGALDLILAPLAEITAPAGLPAEALLMGVLRALSGSGAYAYLASVLNDPGIGPDSYTGYLVSTIQGSTETTFYVLAVYFGAIGVRRMRHAVFVGLAADAAGVAGAAVICRILHAG